MLNATPSSQEHYVTPLSIEELDNDLGYEFKHIIRHTKDIVCSTLNLQPDSSRVRSAVAKQFI